MTLKINWWANHNYLIVIIAEGSCFEISLLVSIPEYSNLLDHTDIHNQIFPFFEVTFSLPCLVEMEKPKHPSLCKASKTVASLTLQTKRKKKQNQVPITWGTQRNCHLLTLHPERPLTEID